MASLIKSFIQRGKNSLKNQNGQMAIFIALIFQILFVFFAMVINVGLIVHDKINLQNSVDLAAYYAAQRQAEILNAMAHQNYMIRQSWKLLAFRTRVIGSMGRLDRRETHPVRRPGADPEAIYVNNQGNPSPPYTCVIYAPNFTDINRDPNSKENLCKEANFNIPELPKVQVLAGFMPINNATARLADKLRGIYAKQCGNVGAFNWYYSTAAFHAFRQDAQQRRLLLRALAQNLQKSDEFLDLDGQSVMTGVRKTLLKNLTHANREGSPQVSMMNSLSGLTIEKWLRDINIAPALSYLDSAHPTKCNLVNVPIFTPPSLPDARNIVLGGDGFNAKILTQWTYNSGGVYQNPDDRFVIGIEKNPWLVSYVGVKATTQPRQIFGPFGPSVTLEARAFAKPFGGRMGPWYGTIWPKGSQQSEGQALDNMLPERVSIQTIGSNLQDFKRFPNYSRFPGDSLGLGSQLALDPIEGDQLTGVPIDMSDYMGIWRFVSPGNFIDPVAWNNKTNKAPKIRQVEIAAIIPDLFDITYYSIAPNYKENYLKRIVAARDKLNIPTRIGLRGDLGSRPGKSMSIQEQITIATETPNFGLRPEAFYFVRDKAHLLTAWIPDEPLLKIKPSFEKRFGHCLATDDKFKPKSPKVPGSCLAGGRTGHSVKLVSRRTLIEGQSELGTDGNAGTILNPPNQRDGW